MTEISALIHTHDSQDAPRLARALDSLRPCDEMLVIAHGEADGIEHVCRQYGATLKRGIPGVSFGTYLADAKHDWILCLLPNEALSDALEASLLEWKEGEHEQSKGFAMAVREETAEGWRSLAPQTRLVNRQRINWTSELPPNTRDSQLLPGDLLRFTSP